MKTAALLDKHIIICLGPGGVGKTTAAAAMGVAAAHRGHAVAIITVDPTRRLKDALGLRHLDANPHPVHLTPAGTGRPGRLDAFALDTKRTFDTLIERFASSPEAAERILSNRLYQGIATGLAGSAEFMAMEKLHHLRGEGGYDVVVVDTPPSGHARDLLSAPSRLTDLLASRAVSLLKSPASLLSGATSLTRVTLGALLKALERWTGLDVLSDLSEFADAFEDMAAGFGARAAQVNELLRSASTAIVLVTTPETHTLATTIELHRDLLAEGFPVAGLVANRVLSFPEINGRTDAGRYPERLRQRLLANYDDLRHLSRRDTRSLNRLHRETGLPMLAVVPLLAELPVSVPQLERFAAYFDPHPAG